MRYRDDDEKLAHVAVAVETSGFIKPTDHYALAIAKEVIGSWDVTCGKFISLSSKILSPTYAD